MNDVKVLAHVLMVLIGLLADRGNLFEVERQYFDDLLDKILDEARE